MESKRYWVGVDWGTESHQVCVLDHAGNLLANRSYPSSSKGLTQLIDSLLKISQGEPTSTYVAIERPHGAVVELLIHHDFVVHSINPKQLDRFRDRHTVAGAKDDRRDAFVLAHSLKTDSWAFTCVRLSDCSVIRLRELLRMDEDLRVDENALQNRLREQLLRYFPAMLNLMANRADPFLWELLAIASTWEEARQVTPETISEILKKHRVRRLSLNDVISVIQEPRLNVTPGTIAAARHHICFLIPRLQLVHQQRRTIGKDIEALLAQLKKGDTQIDQASKGQHRDAVILQSMPGVGRIVLATLLAEAGGSIARRDVHGLRSLGGIAPVTRRSGKQDQKVMRRACNLRLRYAYYIPLGANSGSA